MTQSCVGIESLPDDVAKHRNVGRVDQARERPGRGPNHATVGEARSDKGTGKGQLEVIRYKRVAPDVLEFGESCPSLSLSVIITFEWIEEYAS